MTKTAQINTNSILASLFGVFFGFMIMVIGGMLVGPEIFDHPDYGLSYFGAPGIAEAPYYIGLMVTAACALAIARALAGATGGLAVIRRVFAVSAIFTTAIAATSYPQGPVPYWTHIGICVVLMFVYIWAILWIWRQKTADIVDGFWTVIFLAGMLLLVLSNSDTRVLGLYPLGEVMMFVATVMLLGRATLRLLPTK